MEDYRGIDSIPNLKARLTKFLKSKDEQVFFTFAIYGSGIDEIVEDHLKSVHGGFQSISIQIWGGTVEPMVRQLLAKHTSVFFARDSFRTTLEEKPMWALLEQLATAGTGPKVLSAEKKGVPVISGQFAGKVIVHVTTEEYAGKALPQVPGALLMWSPKDSLALARSRIGVYSKELNVPESVIDEVLAQLEQESEKHLDMKMSGILQQALLKRCFVVYNIDHDFADVFHEIYDPREFTYAGVYKG